MTMKKLSCFIILSLVFIRIRATPVLAAPPPQTEAGQIYVVQTGDWLSKLADKYYGDPLAWPVIYQATQAKAAADNSFAPIENPDLIEVGQKLWIPADPALWSAPSGEQAASASPLIGIHVFDGEPVETETDIPSSFEALAASVATVDSLTLENGALKIVAIAYPIHHTQVGVHLLAFTRQADGWRYTAKSKLITDLVNYVSGPLTVQEAPTPVDGTRLRFVIEMTAPNGSFTYGVNWNPSSETLAVELLTEALQ